MSGVTGEAAEGGAASRGLWVVNPTTPGRGHPQNRGRSGLMGTNAWGPLLGQFHTHQRAAGLANGTIRLYRHLLLDLAEHHRDPSQITTDQLVTSIARASWGANAKKGARSCYRSFFGWAHRTRRLPANPAYDVPSVRVPKGLPRPAPEQVIHRSLRLATRREAFMLRLGAYAGLRDMEIAKVHSRDWDGNRLRVTGKGGKIRHVPIVQGDLVAELDALHGWAFPNRWTGLPITPGYVCKLLSDALEDTYTGHTLRHRYGTRAVNGTKDIQAVGITMGHGSLDTTQLYSLVAEDRLLAVAEAAAA